MEFKFGTKFFVRLLLFYYELTKSQNCI